MSLLRQALPHPLLSLTLLVLWLLLNNSLSAGQLLLGSLLAVLIPRLTAAFWPEQVRIRRPGVLLRFVGIVLWDILVANFIVARRILGPVEALQPGFMRIPLDVQSPLAISLLANTISLTPGTVSCDVSPDRRFLLVHALHVTDVEAEIRQIKSRYERPLQEVFT
ncbi:Na+/H+ antiporter subunit E [Thiofaba sp. EF100]|uniref:Na+/H+ antiporter subunit E n=1 Tax=Thiofaba sp. EF100 TaxID=3121274 RepID=UPI003222055F